MLILRLAFLVPAIVDFGLAALTLHRAIGIADESLLPRAEFAAVAFCWGLLLLLGLARPVERAWILRPTALVIAGIAAAVSWSFAAGLVPFARFAAALVLCAAMVGLCWVGWRQAARYRGGLRRGQFW